jgi:hypothetical protein
MRTDAPDALDAFETHLKEVVEKENASELAKGLKSCNSSAIAQSDGTHSRTLYGGTRDFWWRARMAFALTIGTTIGAIPNLLSYAGVELSFVHVPSWLDGYPAVITIFICGYNLGETNKYNYQAVLGCIIAQIFCLMWYKLFGLGETSLGKLSLFGEVAAFSLICCVMPVATVFKKYANGLNIWVAVAVASGSNDITFGWELIVWGLWGYVGALVANILPPVTAQGLLKQQLGRFQQLSCVLLGSYIQWMVDTEDSQKAHRTVCLELQAELANTLGKIDARADSAFYELRPSFFLHRTGLLSHLYHLLASRLKAVQLCGAFEKGGMAKHGGLKAKITRMRLPMLRLLAHVRIAMEQTLNAVVNNDEKVDTLYSRNVQRELKQVQDSFILASKVQRDLKITAANDIGFDVEGNNAAELFIGCIAAFCHELADFTETYNARSSKIEDTQTWQELLVYSNLRMLQNIDADLVKMSVKVTIAIIIALLLAVYKFSWDSSAAITIAYVVGGHVGGSFTTTVERVLGVVMGAVFPLILLQLTSTNVIGVLAILVCYVFGCSYVRCAGGRHSYSGSVASFVVIEVLFMSAAGEQVTHEVSSDFGMVEQCCLGVVIFVCVELLMLPKHAPELLRISLANTLEEACKLEQGLFENALMQLDSAGFTGVVQKLGGDDEKGNEEDPLKAHNHTIVEMTQRHVQEGLWGEMEKLRGMYVKMTSDMSAQEDLYNQAVMEPEVNRPVFSAKIYKTVMIESQHIRHALQVVKIMYDDKLEWLSEDYGEKDTAGPHTRRKQVMGMISQELVSLQESIQMCFKKVVSICRTESCDATAIGEELIAGIASLEKKYCSARIGLLEERRSEANAMAELSKHKEHGGKYTDEVLHEMLLSPMDRLRLSTLLVALKVIGKGLAVIYRNLAYEYWDRYIDDFDFRNDEDGTHTLTKLHELAGDDGVLSNEEWSEVRDRHSKKFYFVPAGNRYG